MFIKSPRYDVVKWNATADVDEHAILDREDVTVSTCEGVSAVWTDDTDNTDDTADARFCVSSTHLSTVH